MDTHLELNVAAALDDIGRLLGVEEFTTDAGGHRSLLSWLESVGAVVRVGVEGTGSYGVGLSRSMRATGVVVAVDRPNRLVRHRQGKSDPVDAVEAARAVLSGRASGAGKTRDGNVEAIRALTIAKRIARSTDQDAQPDPPSRLLRPPSAAANMDPRHEREVQRRSIATLSPGSAALSRENPLRLFEDELAKANETP